MSAIKFAIVPVEPTREMLGAWYAAKANTGRDGPAYHAMLAAAPPSDLVAVPRGLMERILRQRWTGGEGPAPFDELRALLSPTERESVSTQSG